MIIGRLAQLVRVLRWHRRGHWFDSSIDHDNWKKEYLNIAKRINKRAKYRINDRINSKEVRLIDHENTQRGIVAVNEAVEIAKEVGLDLVEISPDSNPPVCKILDYGKFLYNIEKQEKLNKKKQHIVHVKEIRIRPNTGDHDLITKLKRGQKFLENGDKLKITLMYRGREFFSRKQDGEEVLKKVVEILKDISVVDKPADLQGRRISVILSPK